MIKIIDVDKLFDDYISDYVYKNIGNVKPEEIENKIPMLYEQFGNEKLKELDNKTPNEYYKDYDIKELLTCLKNHLEKRVEVSDFLCEAINAKVDDDAELVKALDNDEDEEFMLYVMNMLSDMGSKKCLKRYLEFILWDYSQVIRELATENLVAFAQDVKEDVLAQFKEVSDEKKECLTEILSNVKNDDRVFDILVAEFVRHGENVPVYANYLAKYGDERALPFLMTAIEKEKISYADFEELRFAIEALGGSYDKERDFSHDKTFRKIRGEKKGANKLN